MYLDGEKYILIDVKDWEAIGQGGQLTSQKSP